MTYLIVVFGPKPSHVHPTFGCIRWGLHEHLNPVCGDGACGGLKINRLCNKKSDIEQRNQSIYS